MKITIVYVLSVLSVVTASYTPIIGVLSQESDAVDEHFPNETYKSYIAASYVKHLESAGGRVVPVWIGQNKDYYRKVVQTTNGILFPGGAACFNQSNGYADAGQILYDLALEANENGDYYPIYGICLGLELLAHVAAGGKELRADCNSKKVNLALEFRPNSKTSNYFVNAPEKVLDILGTQTVTYNYHQYCVTEQNFTAFGLSKDWDILATNKDVNGLEFISVFESKKYPFYAIQFHPEKNPYEFKVNMGFTHTMDSILISQYFANFFINETKKNQHSFPSWETEQKSLIYNYAPSFIGIQNASYVQVYMFKTTDFEQYV